MGGQTGLNLVVELHEDGILDEYGVEVLGTDLLAINRAEDRELFRSLMQDINEPVPESTIVHTIEEAVAFCETLGYPVVVRPAYTLGGTGGGFADDEAELREICEAGLKASPVHQCLIEQSIAGYKEIEYEVIRDANDNAIVVCSMENVDPVGIHTGDSFVVAPVQTLTDRENAMLSSASLKIIRALKICGGCNVQLALNPNSFKYYVIEVNPRVSRSSALASKATGYPIAKISAKLAVGLGLDEIINPITKTSYACFEPALDYIVTKFARFPFDKFPNADRHLGTQMKATGEIMSIGRNFEESFLKAVRSLEMKVDHIYKKELAGLTKEELLEKIIETGRFAPSGGNSQSNHFLVIQNKQIIARLVKMVEKSFSQMEINENMYRSLQNSINLSKKGGDAFCYNAPVLIIVANKKDYGNNQADCALALENMMLEANELDLGSCYINQLKWINEDQKILSYLQSLGMNEDERVYGSLIVGYPDTNDGKPLRKGNEVTWL